MTKSFRVSSSVCSNNSSAIIVSSEIKDKLLQLMDIKGVSLIKASNLLKLPYKVAKQILFTHAANKSIVKKMSVSETTISPRVKHFPRMISKSKVEKI